MNKKQVVFLCAISLLILIAFIVMLKTIDSEVKNSISDPDPDNKIGQIFDVPVVIMCFFPLFFDLFILLHSGYKCFDSLTIKGYKHLYLISVVLILISLLFYVIPFTGLISSDDFLGVIVLFLAVIILALSGLIFNLTATILSHKYKKSVRNI